MALKAAVHCADWSAGTGDEALSEPIRKCVGGSALPKLNVLPLDTELRAF